MGQSIEPKLVAQCASPSLRVDSLELTVDEAQLYELFSEVGRVLSVRVCRDHFTKQSLGYAYVNFYNADDATRALEALNFKSVNEKAIQIKFSQTDPSICTSSSTQVFIKNLDMAIDDKALHDLFAPFGGILSCKVATDASGQSKGHGFVQFKQQESALGAIKELNGMLLNEKQVFVGPFLSRHERSQSSTSVYVKNLGRDITEDYLKKVFSAYGSIESVIVMRDDLGRSKCFGFVNFEHADHAAVAINAVNGKKVGAKKWCVVKARSKLEREAEQRANLEQVERTES